MAKISGTRLCGAGPRKAGAGGGMSLVITPAAGATFSGPISTVEIEADVGSKAAHDFCPARGSHMYNANENIEGVTVIAASTLDDPEPFTPNMTVYASRALSWDQRAENTQQFAETPPRG